MTHAHWLTTESSSCCLTSTEARKPVRDGDEWEKGDRRLSETSKQWGANPEDQGCRGPPPERQNVKAVSVRHCAGATARPRPVAVPTAMQNRVTKTLSVAPPLGNNWKRQKKSNSLSSRLLISSGLASSRFQPTSLLLISPGLYK